MILTETEKIALAIQAFKEMLDSIGAMRSRVPEGYEFNAQFAIQYADSPQYYKDVAKRALEQLEAA